MEANWIGKTISKPNEYVPEGPGETTLEKVRRKNQCLPWKDNYKRFSKPCESIDLHFMNRTKYPFLENL